VFLALGRPEEARIQFAAASLTAQDERAAVRRKALSEQPTTSEQRRA
jgi:hypothetical protein